MSPQQHLTIMIVEDNRADVYLLKQALRKAEIDFTAIVFEDGESALRYIEGEAEPENKPIPDVAILDLNVPDATAAKCWRIFGALLGCRVSLSLSLARHPNRSWVTEPRKRIATSRNLTN